MLRHHSASPVLPLAVGLSLLLHGLLGWSLARTPVAAVAGPRPEPSGGAVRFELVETPESAAVDSGEDTPFVSDRTTRAQDRGAPDEVPVGSSPFVQGGGEGHDLRPTAQAPAPGVPRPGAAAAPAPPATPAPSPPEMEDRPPAPPEAAAEVTVAPAPRQRRQRQPTPPVPEAPVPDPAPSASPQPPATALAPGPAQPGRPSLSEAEAQELARAAAEGELSFAATRHFFAEYFLEVKSRVENTWTLMLMGRYSNLRRGVAVVDFQIQPDGRITGMEVAQSEGDELLPLVCTAAVRSAGPFEPVPWHLAPQIPPELRHLPLRVRVNFNYR